LGDLSHNLAVIIFSLADYQRLYCFAGRKEMGQPVKKFERDGITLLTSREFQGEERNIVTE